MEESATECLTCWVLVLLVLAGATLLSTFRTRPLSSTIARVPLHANIIILLATIATIESSSLARRASSLIDPGHIRDRPTIVGLCVEELLGTVLLLD